MALTPAQLLQLAQGAGFKGQDATTMAAIAMAENLKKVRTGALNGMLTPDRKVARSIIGVNPGKIRVEVRIV